MGEITRVGLIFGGMVLLAAGCASRLETGYKPRPLGAGEETRRAYYAQPFSPESQGKDRGQRESFRSRHPEGP